MCRGVRRSVGFLLAVAGSGGVLFDFGGTIINPAIPYLESLKLFTTAELSHLTSAVVMTAAFSGLFAGMLAERFGRRPTMLFAATLAACACLPICFCGGNYWPFYIGRAIQGFAAGLIGVVVPMYLAETLPAEARGKGAGVFQLMDVVGILFCSLVGLATVHCLGAADDPTVSAEAKNTAWKTIFFSSLVPAVVFLLGALCIEESPVWKQVPVCERVSSGRLATGSLFSRRYMLPFVIAVAVLVCNQAIGCNAVQYYALKMFQDAGLGNAVANAANVSLWVVMLGFTLVGTAFVDRAGRKTILKLGTAGLAVACLSAGGFFCAIEKGWLASSALTGWLVVASMALYIASFSVGPGVVVWLALSELMPDRIRANGMAIGLFLNMMVAYAISDVFLQWVEKSGYSTVLFALAGFSILYFLVAALLLPETKGKTLAEIERMFA